MKICPACSLKYPDAEPRCFVDGSELRAMADPRIGSLLAGRYQIESQLGEGGMAVVYRARSALVDRPVAVKIMNAALVRDAALKERFRREAKTSAAIAHPNIVEILDYGEEEGVPYLVMELLDGMSLDKMIERQPLPIPMVATLGAQLARGLARAHDFSVIHRDLKPENVFVARMSDGKPLVKILDFGIARSLHDQRLTSAGQIFGTPQYMAPERVGSIDAGPAADLYAVGVMLFEMTAGFLPLKADDITGYLIAHMKDEPPVLAQVVPGCPPALSELVGRLLAKKPEDRPVDAHQVEKVLIALAPPESMSVPVAQPVSMSRQAAATLPPTTLEVWTSRSAILEEMFRRVYPTGQFPPEVAQRLGELRGTITRMHELRTAGLREQRKLEQMEVQARESRQRLGHAMEVLGEDLSKARVAHRAAEQQVRPHLEPAGQWAAHWKTVYARLGAGGFGETMQPTAAALELLRDAHDTMGKWLQAESASSQARSWLEGQGQAVRDLEFQTTALRGQLEKLESSYEENRRSLEDALTTAGRELDGLDRRLTEIGGQLVTPVRGRPDLDDLLQRLEHARPAA
jgi:eukaryotic-like serine/threonine-protein kinase